jgi:hypothetical protein
MPLAGSRRMNLTLTAMLAIFWITGSLLGRTDEVIE